MRCNQLQYLLWRPITAVVHINRHSVEMPTLQPATTQLAARAIEPAEPKPASDLTEFDSRANAQWSFNAALVDLCSLHRRGGRRWDRPLWNARRFVGRAACVWVWHELRCDACAHARLRDASTQPHTTGESRETPPSGVSAKTRHKNDK